MRKLILASAVVPFLALSAFAQTSALDKKDMREFYTDDQMTTVKSKEEISAAVKKMDAARLARIAKHCKMDKSQRASFCESFNAVNGQ